MRLPDANKVSAKKKKEIAEARPTPDARVAGEVAAQLGRERSRVIAEESRKAKLASAGEMESRRRELRELQEVLKSRNEKLAEAQKAQAELPFDAIEPEGVSWPRENHGKRRTRIE